MILAYIVLLTSLTISGVAIYYSVAGLVAIFSGALIPIIIMGGSLEVAKLVTTVWLHNYWNKVTWWLKSYLVAAILVLMMITSMGIFGYLSKAHLAQTAAAQQSQAKIAQIDGKIKYFKNQIDDYQKTIDSLKNSGLAKDTQIQKQIDTEQTRIDSANARVQPAIDEQLSVIKTEQNKIQSQVNNLQIQVDSIDKNLTLLESALSSNNIKVAQGIIGVVQDGQLGKNTSVAIAKYKASQNIARNKLISQIQDIQNRVDPVITAARQEIDKQRALAQKQIADSTALIARLQKQIGSVDTTTINTQINALQTKINTSNNQIDNLNSTKFDLETSYRKLEADVGPIKYIANMIYGPNTDQNTLERAVRYVIVLIIPVFDPLAVLLLIASQYTFNLAKETKIATAIIEPKKEETFTDIDYEPESTLKITAEESKAREQALEEAERSDVYKTAKQQWKEENPDKTLKEFKEAYINGEINSLPWEPYVQNGEQDFNSLWSKLRNNE